MDKKLIYIMNHYSNNSVEHFYHIMNLLLSMADKGIKIALVIEKCEDIPAVKHENIIIICQKEQKNIKRAVELFGILKKLIRDGYRKTFTRISINAAIVSILARKFYGGKTYYWQSGTTFEIDRDKTLIKKLKWFFLSYSRLWFVKTFIDYFVTGPETMIKYYIDVVNVKPQKMLMLYNDIDISRFSVASNTEKESLRKELGLKIDEKIILMVHRLSPVRKTDKYIPEIFEAQQFIDWNARLLIIGSGPEEKMLKEKVAKLRMKDQIEFLGAKPNSEIAKYYKVADIFINPSYTEGFPRVLIEAMACGLPIIATNAGGTEDIFLETQKNYVVDREDVNLFKHKLIEVLSDSKLRLRLSQENLDVVKRYSTENVSDMYIERIFEDE